MMRKISASITILIVLCAIAISVYAAGYSIGSSYTGGRGGSGSASEAISRAMSALPPGAVVTSVTVDSVYQGDHMESYNDGTLYTAVVTYTEADEVYSRVEIQNGSVSITNWPDKFNVVVDWDTALTAYTV